jgi:hypothetical protein
MFQISNQQHNKKNMIIEVSFYYKYRVSFVIRHTCDPTR